MQRLTTTFIAFVAACTMAFAVDLYDANGTTPININSNSNIFISPTGNSTTLKLEKLYWNPGKSQDTYTRFGYYIIANGQSQEFELNMGENTIQTNQYLGLWAATEDKVYYSAAALPSDAEASERWVYMTYWAEGDEVLLAGKDYGALNSYENAHKKDKAVLKITVTAAESNSNPSGQPLPAALVSLALMGGIGGTLGLRKRRK